jgi:hypothetical protein
VRPEWTKIDDDEPRIVEIVPEPAAPTPPPPAPPKAAEPAKPLVTGPTTVNDGDDDAEELQVSVFEYNQKKYLIDDNNNVYDYESQEMIGHFKDNTLQLA